MTDGLLAWIDLETTGTNEVKDPILEVALVLTHTDVDLTEVEYTGIICDPGPATTGHFRGWEERMDPVVRKMHEENGLLQCVPNGLGIPRAEDRLIEILHAHGGRHDFTLAGSGVAHFDRRFIARQMPRLFSWFRYPVYDVGIMRRFLELADPQMVRPAPAMKAHRATLDIRDHIDEARWYLSRLYRLKNTWLTMLDAPSPGMTGKLGVNVTRGEAQ